MTSTPKTPAAKAPPVASRRAALVTPGGPAIPHGPHPGMAGGTDREDGPVPAGCSSLPGSPLEPVEPGPSSPPLPGSGPQGAAAGKPDPVTRAVPGRVAARARGRAPQAPAVGAVVADVAPSAGPKPLRGAEWRKAVKAAEAKARRKTTRPAAASKPPAAPPDLPAAPPGSAALIAAASCTGCEWTAGPGSAGDVDDAAAKHTGVGHSTGVSAELGGAA